MTEAFDRVVRLLPSGAEQVLSKHDFELLPLSERIRAILSKQLRFFRAGKEVPAKEALRDR